MGEVGEAELSAEYLEEIHNWVWGVFGNSIFSHTPSLPKLYRASTELPPKLDASFAVLEMMNFKSLAVEDALVQSLLLDGESSPVMGALEKLWRRMSTNVTSTFTNSAIISFSEDLLDYLLVSGVDLPQDNGTAQLGFWPDDYITRRYGTLTTDEVAENCIKQRTYPMENIISKMICSLGVPFEVANPSLEMLRACLAKAVDSLAEVQRLPWVLWDVEFITEERVVDFAAMVEEYNWEWASASFDWTGGQPSTMLPRLQGILAASPWAIAS